MKLLKNLVVLTCPECNKDLEIYTRQTYPLIQQWKCTTCGWSHTETQKIVKKQLKPDKPKVEKKDDNK